MTGPKAHKLHISIKKRIGVGEWAQLDFFKMKCENILDVHIGSEFCDCIAYVNLTTIFYKVFLIFFFMFA